MCLVIPGEVRARQFLWVSESLVITHRHQSQVDGEGDVLLYAVTGTHELRPRKGQLGLLNMLLAHCPQRTFSAGETSRTPISGRKSSPVSGVRLYPLDRLSQQRNARDIT
jgi:hypothetical protein